MRLQMIILMQVGGGDALGKLPLALQQLSLAKTRLEATGDIKLSNEMDKKISDLISQINQ
jgi:hypothetical protein